MGGGGGDRWGVYTFSLWLCEKNASRPPDLQKCLQSSASFSVLTFKEGVFGVGGVGVQLPPLDNTLPYQGRLCLVSCLRALA